MALLPSECAFALAIPLHRDEMIADLEADSDKDYAKTFQRLYPAASINFLWARYEEAVSIVVETAERVGRLEVEVVHQTTRSALRSLLRRHRVVTLVAHWRAARFEPGDVLDPTAVLEFLAREADKLGEDLQACLTNEELRVLLALRDVQTLRQGLVGALNRLVTANGDESPPDEDHAEVPGSLSRLRNESTRRERLDNALAGLVRPGNRLELSDGMWSAEKIVNAIPEHYEGTLDLTVCNSVLLGDAVKRARPNCLVAMRVERVGPIVNFVIYSHVMAHVAATGADYADVLLQSRKRMGNTR